MAYCGPSENSEIHSFRRHSDTQSISKIRRRMTESTRKGAYTESFGIRTGKEIRFRFWLSEDKAGKEAKRRPTGW